MADVMIVERASWKAAAGKSIATREHIAHFYCTSASRAASNGQLRVHLLYLGDRPIAHICGAVFRNQYYAIKTSYDSAYRARSPGIVLFQYALRDSCSQGLDTFHFLGDMARWKRDFSSCVDQQVDVCVFPSASMRCLCCSYYKCNLRPFIKSRLPFIAQAKDKLTARMTR
jgi:CelD/BcsL family acetyltransferase involved in cellulose biosynthesis